MTHQDFLIAVQLISDEGPGRLTRRAEGQMDATDAESRRQLGVVGD